VLQRIAATVFPMRCPGCGCAAEPVCASCAAGLRAAPTAPPPAGVDAWVAPFAYAGVARELIARVKYRGTHAAVQWLADAIVCEVARLGIADRVDAVVWTPTTPARRRARGFDHAELLARPVARSFGFPVMPLLRRLPGPPQTGLPAAERRRGPVFAARNTAPFAVLLVDDVATTGATLAAAATALRDVGVARIAAATAARTPLPST
jgi:ComF family protein